jgi:ribosomal protein S18 acetylase RimI-like enzyme
MACGEVFWIAVDALAGGHEVLGFSSHRVDDNHHGVSVYVRGECGRRGIGSALLQAAEASARRAGATRMDIDSSLAAVEFYKRHGFEEVARGEHQLPSGQPMSCVFMQKVLVRPEARGRRTSA